MHALFPGHESGNVLPFHAVCLAVYFNRGVRRSIILVGSVLMPDVCLPNEASRFAGRDGRRVALRSI